MSEVRDRYQDPGAFRTALTQRLRRLAESSPWTLAELQRQFAYDRFLQRLNAGDDGWVLKGAAALLAREGSLRQQDAGPPSASFVSTRRHFRVRVHIRNSPADLQSVESATVQGV